MNLLCRLFIGFILCIVNYNNVFYVSIFLKFTELDESAGAILKWVFKQLDGDEIEDVTDEILDKLVNGELEPAEAIYCKRFTIQCITIRTDLLAFSHLK